MERDVGTGLGLMVVFEDILAMVVLLFLVNEVVRFGLWLLGGRVSQIT